MTVSFEGSVTDAEFDAYLGEMSRMLERRSKTVTILDARSSGRPPPIQRKRQADWLKANEVLLRQYSCGSAFVINSALVRGVLTAILWVQPMATPHTVVGTIAEAEAWAHRRLVAEGVAPPPPLAGAAIR